jgi:PAS domain S-box-containing protein
VVRPVPGSVVPPVVLNVNDDEVRRYVVGRMLRGGGFAVVDAASGGEALARLGEGAVDVVLLDVKLPDIDGFEVCRRIKADPATVSLPVVMVSAVLVDDVDRVHGLESGADGYLTDPLHPAVVVATLRALLRARRAEEALRESEAQYRLLFEASPVPAWVVDLDTLAIVAANDAAVRHLGYARAELIGKPAVDIRPVAERQRALASLAAGREGRDEVGAWRYLRSDGTVLDALVRTRRIRYAGREARLVLAQDVTEERRAERRQAAQFAATRVLAESGTLEEAMPRLLAVIGEGLGWELGEFWVADAARVVVRRAAVWRPAGRRAPGDDEAPVAATLPMGAGLVGRVWRAGQPEWAPDVTADPAFLRTATARAEGLRAAVLFPVVTAGEVLGVVAFFSRDVERPDAALLRVLADLGGQIGDFLGRRRTEEAVRQRDRLRALSRATLRAREEEARRIARELHDETGQLLASVHIALGRLVRELAPAERARFDEVSRLLDLAEAHLRRIAYELRPVVLDDLGLGPALEFLAAGVQSRAGIHVDLDVADEARLPAETETALYRVVQEGLSNVVRHAGASRVRVALVQEDGVARCTVTDDGAGFDVAATLGRTGEPGLGLLGIRERVEALGGRVEIRSSPGQGTELTVSIPVGGGDGAAHPPR